MSYWWYSDTNKTTSQCQDVFTSRLKTASGAPIGNALQQSCNTSVTNYWVLKTYDLSSLLSAYKGKQVMLFFEGTNSPNQYQPTDFFVDDVTITVQ